MAAEKNLSSLEIKLVLSSRAEEEYYFWLKTNKKMITKINKLIDDIKLNHYQGLGKPEPLRFELSGYWSRRIDAQNRLVYKIVDNTLKIASCRFHY